MAAQLLLGLSILVGLHEAGHMLAAKFFGMKVEKFSIGFPPKVFAFKIGETEYSLGSIPLGGFVKISGMVDESLDTAHLNSEPQPWEFRAKPAWQRMIVMLGGIIFNIITGIIIFIAINYWVGQKYFDKDVVNKNGGIYVGDIGESIGLKRGDKIIEINGDSYTNFNDTRNPNIILSANSYYTIIRGSEQLQVQIPEDFLEKIASAEGNTLGFISPLMPFEVEKTVVGSNADKAGIQAGDKILAVNNQPTECFQDLKLALDENKSQTVDLSVKRESETINLTVDVTEKGTIGFYPKILLEQSSQSFTLLEAIPVGTTDAFNVIILQLKAFGKMLSGAMPATKSLSGPIGIAKVYGGTWDWLKFWSLTGMLSMVLAFMNLLPIPALDGGHVMFLTYEMIARKAPPAKFLEIAQRVGMALLLSLMIFAFGNDIYLGFKSKMQLF